MSEDGVRGSDYLGIVRGLAAMVERMSPGPGTARTPERWVAALLELTEGYQHDPAEILATRFDGEGYDQVVVLSGISYVSLCEHHLLPFTGTASVAYLPSEGQVVGLSKLARLVECFARRLQVQERMTQQIGEALVEHLKPRGVAVVVHGQHSCMAARGIKKPGSVMTTYYTWGAFRDKPEARAEVLAMMGEAR